MNINLNSNISNTCFPLHGKLLEAQNWFRKVTPLHLKIVLGVITLVGLISYAIFFAIKRHGLIIPKTFDSKQVKDLTGTSISLNSLEQKTISDETDCLGESKESKLNNIEKKNGILNGQSKITFKDGYIFEGEFKDNNLNGKGKFTTPEGDIYEGEFKDNCLNGQGKITFKNGDIYEGEFKDDELNGQGKITFKNGNIFEGEFKDDKLNGKGKITTKEGKIFEGEFKDDKLNGESKITIKDGEIYEGEFNVL